MSLNHYAFYDLIELAFILVGEKLFNLLWLALTVI